MAWVLKLKDLDGVVIDADVSFRDLQVRWVLNSPGSLEVTLPFDATSYGNWAPGERELVLVKDGTPVWGGYLWQMRASTRDRRSVTASGQGWASRLRRRVVTSDLIYVDVAQHQIAWNLISHTQGQADGSMGFSQGVHAGSTKNRNRSYCANMRPEIFEEIERLAAFGDGFDFEIDASKAFNTWASQRGASSGITLTGADELYLDWEEDATEAASYVSAIGSDECNPQVLDVSDAGAIGRFKRLHQVAEVSETNSRQELGQAANEQLRQRKRAIFRSRVNFDADYGPAWGTWWLGDTLVLNPAADFATFNKTLRIVEIGLSLEDPGATYLELTLDAAT